MAAIGNLNDYVKFQMAEGMTKGGGEGAGMASTAAQAWDTASPWASK